MINNNEIIYGVVVTYNRKELLKECIESLINQTRKLDMIVIVDNASTDGTDKMISLLLDKYKNLKYLRLNENIGGAGGFYEGIKYSFNDNADWIWIMDDDSEPDEICLNSMLEILETNKKDNIGIICPLIQHKTSKQIQWYHHKLLDKYLYKDLNVQKKYDEVEVLNKKFIEIDSNAFVGPLINRRVIDKHGFPEKDYFIWSDDLEYIYRLSRESKCLLSIKSIIYHKDNNFDPNTGKLNGESVWKLYYGIRNRLLFVKKHQKYAKYRYVYYSKQLYISFRTSIILFIRKKAGKKSIIPLQGFWHGLINKKGKLVEPFKLNN